MSLKGKNIVVGMTGGIACYKIPYLVRYLVKDKANVKVIMTDAATKFITPLTLETVSENPVAVKMFPDEKYIATLHIDMAEWADLFVITPATANFMGKINSGISDDLLTTIVCATAKPVMICPAMNPQMWLNPVTQRNYNSLKDLGYHFIDPAEGQMVCHHWGVGRVAEPDEIFEHIKKFFQKTKVKKNSKNKKKILITAGPTRESIDPVRFISNYSSGKMGYALAQAAVDTGAETTLITGPVELTPPAGAKVININSTDDLWKTTVKEVKNHDILIMAAAPADFKPKNLKKAKIKRTSESKNLELTPTRDILKEVAKTKRKNQIFVGFALETENVIANARKKLKEKNLDMIVLNQPGEKTGFNTDTNEVTVLIPGRKQISISLTTKHEISIKLLDIIYDLQ